MAVITIARQIGSDGNEIGQAVARELGLVYLDKELVRQMVEKVGVPEAADPEQQQHLVQRLVPLLLLSETDALSMERVMADTAPATRLTHTTSQPVMAEVIREMARQGHAVIMGRGSQVILQTTPAVLHVHIGAPLALRVERVGRQYGVRPDEAAWLVDANDRERAAYLRAEGAPHICDLRHRG